MTLAWTWFLVSRHTKDELSRMQLAIVIRQPSGRRVVQVRVQLSGPIYGGVVDVETGCRS